MIRKYVAVSKPLIFKEFDEFKKPIGWLRLEYLKRDILSDTKNAAKFTKTEIRRILKEECVCR